MNIRYTVDDESEIPIRRIRITFQETKGSLREARLTLRNLEHLLQVLSLESLELDNRPDRFRGEEMAPAEHGLAAKSQHDSEITRFLEESVDAIDTKLSMRSPLIVDVLVAGSTASAALGAIWYQVLRIAVRTDETRNDLARGRTVRLEQQVERERLRAELVDLIQMRAGQRHPSLPTTRYTNAARAAESIEQVEVE